MSTTVTYKGSTLTTVNNNTKTLKTAGKYMEGDVVLNDESVDVSQDTVTADKLMQGYTAHDRTGTLIIGTASGGSGDGYVWQDAEGYIHLSDEEGTSISVEPLSVTQNGTYTAPTGKAYSPVTVNVDGGTPAPTPSKKWVRPSDWPDLSKMDISGGDVIYMTSYADEARGFCDFYLSCTGKYTVELGHISGLSFIAESSYTYNSGEHCELYYGSNTEAYKVIRVTGTAITRFTMHSSSLIIIDGFKGYSCNQGIIDVVGKLPSGTSLYFNSIYNLINVEITSVKLVSASFSNCYSLTSLDVSEWDTSAVTSMSNMFNGCPSLTSLDVSNWDTGAVKDMSNAFSNCYSLTSLNVSDWDTSAVTNMSYMFSGCYSLASLDVSSWNTSAVTSINNMFTNCSFLTSLDVSGWNMSAVKNMSYMFSSCNSLTSLDVGDWVMNMVTNMSYIFNGCYSLTSLDVSDWNMSKITNISGMFNNCYSLTSLDVSSWNTSAVTNMSYIFSGCYSLASLDVSSWNTSAVTNMSNAFSNCYSLTSLDVSQWDFTKVTTASNAASMFKSCYGLHGSITIPASITQIGTYFLNATKSLYEYHFLSTTPPTLANTNAFTDMNDYGGKKIYVPAASLEAYKTAANWSTYASYIEGE